jgi:hypothetical protein
MTLDLDFIVIHDCARKFIQATMWTGNGEWMFSKNVHHISKFVADIQTICPDCSYRVGSVPSIPVWVANSRGLNSIIEFTILILYWVCPIKYQNANSFVKEICKTHVTFYFMIFYVYLIKTCVRSLCRNIA